MPALTRFLALVLGLALWPSTWHGAAAAPDRLNLPELGDTTSGIVSSAREHKLGRVWLMGFRSQVEVIADPLLQAYVEDLIYSLVPYSELKDRRLEIVVVDSPTMNAFAVPGGVIGVHNGLFLHADTEGQMASVLTHELAHLSQRHYARGVEQQKRAAIPTMAGLLASLVVAATAGGEAGMAAISATQAAALQNQLRFSRQHEQEADRIGMENLVEAGYDPHAAPAMFDNMQQAYRYAGKRPPEFLLTHPLTESRINDTRNRARQYPRKMYTENLEYQLMRARVALHFAQGPGEGVKRFSARLESQSKHPEADHYGMALAQLEAGRPDRARKHIEPLLDADPNRIAYVLVDARIDIARGELGKALETLKKHLAIAPNNHPLTMAYANALLKADMAHRAEEVLSAHSKQRPNDPAVWYLLAEVQGLAGNIIGVHRSRAEFFILNGMLDQAKRQLGYALPLAKNDRVTTAIIKERIKQVQKMTLDIKNL